MAPKRKPSTAALGSSSFYQLPGSSSSKKRLAEQDDQDDAPLSRVSSFSNIAPPRPYQHVQQHQDRHPYQHYTSPSLENIVTNFDQLRAPSRYTNSASGSSVGTNPTPPPMTPDYSYRENPQPVYQHYVPPPPPPKVHAPPAGSKTYLIMGASRGIGLELAKQLLQRQHQVIAVVRNPSTASQLWQVTGALISRPGSCIIEQCDVSDPADIDTFISRMRSHIERGGSIDTIIPNAGILEYEAGLGALDVEFEMLERHLRVNCVGNIVLARKLLMLNDLEAVRRRREQDISTNGGYGEDAVIGSQVMFMSSDSGSMADFREYEDGFAAYGASKAALNMMIRHMAAELKRRGQKKFEDAQKEVQQRYYSYVETGQKKYGTAVRPWEEDVAVLAMHPGEVSTDMANVDLGWEVEGVISAEESVRCMLEVLEQRTRNDSGTFWRWDGTQHPW